jgi:hypothetical protein
MPRTREREAAAARSDADVQGAVHRLPVRSERQLVREIEVNVS